jgi:redox-sensitive bicupin YhaK (pirin superfamily)
MTSAGTGIVHSEVAHGPNPVHFVQIWATPQDSGLTPSYYTRHFTEEDKRDKLLPVVAPLGSVVRSAGTNETTVSEMREGDGPTPIHSPIWLYATILSPGKLITHSLHMPEKDSVGRKAYVQIVQTSGYNSRKAKGNGIRINASVDIYEGDGTFIEGLGGEEITFENIGQGDVEVLVFDLA